MAGSQNGGSGTASALRLAAVAGVALLTANCAGTPHPGATASVRGGRQVDPKYGVVPSPRLYGENDPIPKGGGRAMVGKPYVVAGHTYVPRENPRGYVREGLASWYGTAFHGRQTANGEVFDRFSVAAAHPTLPLPSYARVTNLANGHSMVVRVNDRGPYHAGRLMDVSERVAEALEFHRRGTTRVRVEYLGMASVAGSDDRKLMATLRTDGSPAGRPSGANLMVADAGEEAKPFAFRQPEPEAAPVRPVVERPRVAPAPVVVAEAPRRAAPVRVAEVAPRPAPAPAPVRVAQAAPPRPGLRALPAAMRPDAAARDRGALAQAMLAAAQAAPAARAATPRHAAPLPLTSPLQLSGAPPRPPLRPGPEHSLTAKLDGAEAGERKGRAPRARTADML